MKKSEFVLVVLVILLLAVTVVQAYQITSLNSKATALATGNFKVVGGAEFSSYDEMMAEHHGGEAQAPTAPAQGIGGCG